MRHLDTDLTSLAVFLVDRLTEDLARLWEREAAREGDLLRPGLAAQVAIIDEVLATLRSGLLPSQRELRLLLLGYGAHPDYDPVWAQRLSRPA
ncbi:hypothetical protein EUA93_18515 [Nocardioides oleivorans]|uniref:Uncharacterized protein n=1 Tax=Nocardioides oleivorans TaxID=273676 RepID=A0A4Q2RTH3_9ACTN|nr:hypothetical protein [Nocardioides oleivorans]RYB92088.1 hypothetical protein EUA93_18515 [Nocardioides oleivorans]